MRGIWAGLLVWMICAVDGFAVDFNRDVRPILAAKCFACHGPDEGTREAELRLDQREPALAAEVLSPGDAAQSELIRRIESHDPELRMPPVDAGAALSKAQQATLREWVAEGAAYATHWAFIPPQKTELPSVENDTWVRNEIDRFILQRLEKAGVRPAAPATRVALVRRLYLDLIGLPPTPEQADAFVNDTAPRAYERLVDRLLKSPHYGERWARAWLDLARYSDTNGYEKDRNRSIWPYRDWVIRALNQDLPFDQFTVEQLAGDMLPGASQSQRVATGLHRNTMLNEEGGIDPLEYRFYAMVDRVATTGTVWLGLTTGCAQCHSHKYDPISHTDYYRLLGLLNNADEPDLTVRSETLEQQERQLTAEIRRRELDLGNHFPVAQDVPDTPENRAAHLERKYAEWETQQRAIAARWQVLNPHTLTSNSAKLERLEDGSIFSSGDITKRDLFTLQFRGLPASGVTALQLEVLPDERLPASGPGRTFYEGRKGDFFLSELTVKRQGQTVAFSKGSQSYGKISVGSGKAVAANVFDGEGSTGWATSGNEGRSARLVLNFAEPTSLAGEVEISLLFERHFAASLGRFRLAVTTDPHDVVASPWSPALQASLIKPEGQRTDEERQDLRLAFYQTAAELADARKPIDALRKQLPRYPTTMVMQERPADHPRETHRHHRGEFLSPRELVTPGLPDLFGGVTEKSPRNRLELARWLVSADNPLVARVTVNRAWRSLFGVGVMRTSGDFGTQSDPPTHPELLDWLAVDFMEQGWSLKRLHKQIVMSATYRQDSSRGDGEDDPSNLLYSRGPRHRLDAERIRDTLLQSSGLLSRKLYGPSVYPPQPAAVTALAYGRTAWPVSKGEDRYRRSLYTFNKRTAPFAAYTVFDAPTGESCVARRGRSNTPLQALTLLNDEMFFEMARSAARQVPDKASAEDGVSLLFRRFLTREPEAAEVRWIVDYWRKQRARLAAGELDAKAIAKQPNGTDLAAWTLVARVLMNLDEVITKQ